NSGRVGRAEVVEAAIARTEAVNPALNGVAYEAFDRARAQAAAPPRAGFFSGVPTFIKDNVDVAGLPTMRGTGAWPPRRRALARSWPPVRCRLPMPMTAAVRSEFRRPGTDSSG